MDEIISYLKNKKNLINLLTLGIIVLGLPLGIGALRQQQVFTSKANEAKIEFLTKEQGGPTTSDGSSCVQTINGNLVTKCKTVSIKITAPDTLTAKAPELVSTIYAYVSAGEGGCCKGDSYCANQSGFGPQWTCSDFNPNCEGSSPNACKKCWNTASETVCGQSVFGGVANQVCNYESNTCGLDATRVVAGSCHAVEGQCGNCTWNEGPQEVCGQTVPGGTDKMVCKYQSSTCGEGIKVVPNSCHTVSGVCGAPIQCPDMTCTYSERKDGSTKCYSGTGASGFNSSGCKWMDGCSKEVTCPTGDEKPSSGGDCVVVVSVDNGANWLTGEIKDKVNKDDTNLVSVRTKDFKTIITGAKLSYKDPVDGKTNPIDWTKDGYFKFAKPGDYILTAENDGACKSKPTATVKVKGPASAAPSASSGGPTGKITHYRIADDAQALKKANYKVYKSTGVNEDFPFSDTKPGEKVVLVQFKDDKGNEVIKSAKIILLGLPPKVSNVYCYYDVKKDAVSVVVRGANFGTTAGTVIINGQNISKDLIDGWEDTAVMTRINNPQSNNSGSKLKVTVNNPDGQLDQGACELNVSQFDLGATWMCNVANTHDTPNTTLSIYDLEPLSRSKANETVTISKEGTIKNVKTKLKAGNPYKICVDPPLGLKTCSDKFIFSPGTIVTKLSVPIGELNDDGNINNIDAQILRQQFGVGTGKTADFLQKGSVNSFDWGCMLQNFNKSDASEPS